MTETPVADEPEGKEGEGLSEDSESLEVAPESEASKMDPDATPAMHEVEVEAYAILGTTAMPVSQLLRMGRGAVVELDTKVGDQIEIKVNDLLIARGEIVVVQDKIAIEIKEIVKRDQE